MSDQPLTLTRYLLTREKTTMPPEDLALVMERIAVVGKRISRKLIHASLGGELGYTGDTNVQGEQQKKLDEWTNQVFLEVFKYGYPVCSLVSEEMEEPLHYERNCRGRSYAVLYDPLDGSSNSDINGPLGTIFSIRERASGHRADASDLLAPGSRQVAAGYIVYGPATQLVCTAGAGVDIFTLDRELGEFILWREKVKMPPRGATYAVNHGNAAKWHPGTRKFIEHITSRKDKKTSYSLRYCGCFAGDFHRCLLEGGMYIYPGEKSAERKAAAGRLRLMYELAPMAMVAEQAGGRASNGTVDIMDIMPSDIHERQPIYIGSSEEVTLAESFKPES